MNELESLREDSVTRLSAGWMCSRGSVRRARQGGALMTGRALGVAFRTWIAERNRLNEPGS